MNYRFSCAICFPLNWLDKRFVFTELMKPQAIGIVFTYQT